MAALTLEQMDLSGLDLKSEAGLRKVKNYLFLLTEQLQYVLSNLDTENLGTELQTELMAVSTRASDAAKQAEESSTGLCAFKNTVFAPTVEQFQSQLLKSDREISMKVGQAEFTSAVPKYSDRDPAEDWTEEEKDARKGFLWYDSRSDAIKEWDGEAWLETLENSWAQRASAQMKINAEGIAQKVSKGAVVSEINQSAEEVKIKAQHIALEGALSVNGSFQIDEEGYLNCTGGSIGDFSVDAQGGLFGTGALKVGGMTLHEKSISGLETAEDLKIRGKNLAWENYPGNGLIYFLGIDGEGKLCLCDLAVMDHNTETIAKDVGLYAFYPGAAPGPRPSASINVIQITSRGEGLVKRAGPSTDTEKLGSCSAGEIYNAGESYTDAEGFLWTRCSWIYRLENGGYVGSTLERPFWVRQYSNSGVRYYDFTTVNV